MFAEIVKSRKNKKGFTLIEMMVVVGIVAILAATAIPAYLSYRRDAEVEVAKSSMFTVVDSINSYNAINNEKMDVFDAEGNIAGTVQDILDKFEEKKMQIIVDAIDLDADMSDYCVYNKDMQSLVLREDVSKDAWAKLYLGN